MSTAFSEGGERAPPGCIATEVSARLHRNISRNFGIEIVLQQYRYGKENIP